RISVGIGTVHDDRGKVTVVDPSSLVSRPLQKTSFEQFRVAHDASVGRDWEIDPKSECAAAPLALHQLADRIRDQIGVFGATAEQQFNRKAPHQATRKFPNVDHLTSWPGRNLRFGKLSHFSSQRIDADSAEWRSHELAVMRM